MRRRFTSVLVLAAGLGLGLALTGAGEPQQAGGTLGLQGESATLLPSGQWLFLGGEDQGPPLNEASVVDTKNGPRIALRSGLVHAREWHTATVLPDGTVAVIGGVGLDGKLVEAAERFDPRTGDFTSFEIPGLAARYGHTSTLLSDGNVLIAGGLSEGKQTLGDAVLWNPRKNALISVQGGLKTPRSGHAATLTSDGRVLISGGTDRNGAPIEVSELYDPKTQSFAPRRSIQVRPKTRLAFRASIRRPR